jgi:hypothetical protein
LSKFLPTEPTIKISSILLVKFSPHRNTTPEEKEELMKIRTWCSYAIYPSTAPHKLST